MLKFLQNLKQTSHWQSKKTNIKTGEKSTDHLKRITEPQFVQTRLGNLQHPDFVEYSQNNFPFRFMTLSSGKQSITIMRGLCQDLFSETRGHLELERTWCSPLCGIDRHTERGIHLQRWRYLIHINIICSGNTKDMLPPEIRTLACPPAKSMSAQMKTYTN